MVQDNDFGTWNAFGNQYWPAKYLIDANGRIRFAHFGEGSYNETEEAIRTLLDEAGSQELGTRLTKAPTERAAPGIETPETYLGAARAQGFVNGQIQPGSTGFGQTPPKLLERLPANAFAYQGR